MTLNMREFTVLQPRSTINRLLLACCPSTILWRIITINIDAIKRCSGVASLVRSMAFPHILIKHFKPIPSLTYFNSTTTVMLKIPLIRVVAALAHINPSNINRVAMSVVLPTHKSHTVFSFAVNFHVGRIS